jgi:hypothetical protein
LREAISGQGGKGVATQEHEYRGRKIQIVEEEGQAPKVLVDGDEVHVEKTESGGYVSANAFYKEHGSLLDLAQAVVRSRG